MPADFAVTELWRVLAGLAPGRRTADLGIGAAIKLVPWAHNPKELFDVPHGANGSNGAAAAVPGRPVAAALT